MLQRGRKGSSRFALLQGGKATTLPCSSYFGDEERKLWHQIVRSTGPDYFSVPTRPLLEQFVMLSIAARRSDITQRERIAVSLCIAKLASSMRLSQFTSLEKPRRKPANAALIWDTE
jgi:hypothetical protein